MPTLHTVVDNACARYFYLPASNERGAEVILVLNSSSDLVTVPTREEDVELYTFYVRSLSTIEKNMYDFSQTWKIFNSWGELLQDHQQFSLSAEVLEQLSQFKERYALQQEVAA